jgi:hypothetical protein
MNSSKSTLARRLLYTSTMANPTLRSSLLALVLICTATRAFAAERLAILPFSGTNVHPGYLQASQELLRDHLSTSGRFAVTAISGETPAAELTAAEATEAGRTAGCDLVVAGHLIRLQSVVRLRVTVYRVADGSQVFSDSMSTSGGPDQLDPVIRRLSSGIVTGKQSKDNAEIDTVTEGESEAYMKKAATKVFGLKLGLLAPLSRPNHDAGVGPSIGIFWLYDARTFLGEIFLDGSPNDNLHSFNIGMGGYVPLERGDTTPYVGGGVAWSAANFGGAGASGLRLHGAVGMLFGRLSTVQFRGELGYFINTFSESNSGYYGDVSSTNSGGSTVSHGPMFTVGLGL